MTFLQTVSGWLGLSSTRGYPGTKGPVAGRVDDTVKPEDFSEGRLPPHSDGSPFTSVETKAMGNYWYNINKTEQEEYKKEKDDDYKDSLLGVTEGLITKVAIIGAVALIVSSYVT